VPVVAWLSFLLLSSFVLGCAVGSFLNVCIYRMATGRSISWPGSHCGACVRPIPGWHNVPLLTYLILGGKCALCGARFSARYFLVELLTGVAFVLLLVLGVGWNWQGVWDNDGWWYLSAGLFPPDVAPYYLAHVFLACLLIIAVGALADGHPVPPAVVIAGGIMGFVFASVYPQFLLAPPWQPAPWPVVGAVLAVWLVPAVARLALADESAADVAILAGGFLGWQPVAAALIVTALMRGLVPLMLKWKPDRCLLDEKQPIPPQRARGLGRPLAVMLPLVWLAWPLRGWLLHPAALIVVLIVVFWASRHTADDP
jgi:leader peptidase (prepilin peptidase)/N-methyltransferase